MSDLIETKNMEFTCECDYDCDCYELWEQSTPSMMEEFAMPLLDVQQWIKAIPLAVKYRSRRQEILDLLEMVIDQLEWVEAPQDEEETDEEETDEEETDEEETDEEETDEEETDEEETDEEETDEEETDEDYETKN